jgi:hypothetical protein
LPTATPVAWRSLRNSSRTARRRVALLWMSSRPIQAVFLQRKSPDAHKIAGRTIQFFHAILSTHEKKCQKTEPGNSARIEDVTAQRISLRCPATGCRRLQSCKFQTGTMGWDTLSPWLGSRTILADSAYYRAATAPSFSKESLVKHIFCLKQRHGRREPVRKVHPSWRRMTWSKFQRVSNPR